MDQIMRRQIQVGANNHHLAWFLRGWYCKKCTTPTISPSIKEWMTNNLPPRQGNMVEIRMSTVIEIDKEEDLIMTMSVRRKCLAEILIKITHLTTTTTIII